MTETEPQTNQHEPREWALFGGRATDPDGAEVFRGVGAHPRFTQMYGFEPVPLRAVEDPEGAYWSFLNTGAETPTMVYERENLFRMCFPYGVDSEVARDRGEVVRLTIIER